MTHQKKRKGGGYLFLSGTIRLVKERNGHKNRSAAKSGRKKKKSYF